MSFHGSYAQNVPQAYDPDEYMIGHGPIRSNDKEELPLLSHVAEDRLSGLYARSGDPMWRLGRKVRELLFKLPEEEVLEVFHQFEETDARKIRNKSAFMHGIITRRAKLSTNPAGGRNATTPLHSNTMNIGPNSTHTHEIAMDGTPPIPMPSHGIPVPHHNCPQNHVVVEDTLEWLRREKGFNEPLDEAVLESINELSGTDAGYVMHKFSEVDLATVHNKNGFLRGIIKRVKEESARNDRPQFLPNPSIFNDHHTAPPSPTPYNNSPSIRSRNSPHRTRKSPLKKSVNSPNKKPRTDKFSAFESLPASIQGRFKDMDEHTKVNAPPQRNLDPKVLALLCHLPEFSQLTIVAELQKQHESHEIRNHSAVLRSLIKRYESEKPMVLAAPMVLVEDPTTRSLPEGMFAFGYAPPKVELEPEVHISEEMIQFASQKQDNQVIPSHHHDLPDNSEQLVEDEIPLPEGPIKQKYVSILREKRMGSKTIDESVLLQLEQLGEDTALVALDKLSEVNLAEISNKSGFFMGILIRLKKQHQHQHHNVSNNTPTTINQNSAHGRPRMNHGTPSPLGSGQDPNQSIQSLIDQLISSSRVRELFDALRAKGDVCVDELDPKCIRFLAEAREEVQFDIVTRFLSANQENVRNKSGFLIGVIRRCKSEHP